MNVAIVEDILIQRELLEVYVESLCYNVVGSFETGERILEEVRNLSADLVFMDINLKGLKNGVDTARELSEKHGLKIIYTTAQTDVRVLGSAADTEPLDILIKPFSVEQLQASILLARHSPVKEVKDGVARYLVKDGFLIYKDGHMFERLPIEELLYAKGEGNYFTLYFKNSRATLKGSLGALEEQLPNSLFCRINRSIIVALSAVSSFNNRRIILSTKEEFSLSKSFAEEVIARLLGS